MPMSPLPNDFPEMDVKDVWLRSIPTLSDPVRTWKRQGLVAVTQQDGQYLLALKLEKQRPSALLGARAELVTLLAAGPQTL